MPQALFREAALRRHGERLQGELILSQPLPHSVLSAFIVALAVLALWFLAGHDYARKRSVSGTLVPDRGLIEVRAPFTGTVREIGIALDAQVETGAPLFVLQLDHSMNDEGGLVTDQLRQLGMQQDTVRQRMEAVSARAAARDVQLTWQMESLDTRLAELRTLLSSEADLLQLRQRAMARAHDLHQRGMLAAADRDAARVLVLQQENALAQLRLRREELRAERRALATERTTARLDGERELQVLEAELAGLRREELRLGAERETLIRAPLGGRITSLQRVEGTNVQAGELVLAILPDGAQLEVELLVPSAAAGFVAAGQQVNLRLDAFPYQKFGVQHASIHALAASAAPAGERDGLPVYKARATLERQTITAYGNEHALRPGMALSADIVLDHRSLLEWLLEPLFSIRGKS